MWGMLRKWTPTGKIFQISKLPDTLSFVITPRMFWQNFTKIGHIHIPYKFSQSGCIPPKIKCEILAHKGSQTTCYLASWNRKPIRQRDFLASMTMDQDSPGKSDPMQTRFIKAGPCIKKGNFVFNIMYGKFWLDGVFFVRYHFIQGWFSWEKWDVSFS